MNVFKITSPTNQTIKDLVRLKDRKSIQAETMFVVEGYREIVRAMKCEFELDSFYFCSELLHGNSQNLLSELTIKRIAEISKEAFVKVATRENSDGILAVFRQKNFSFNDIVKNAKNEKLFTVAIENVEKPGNLGALLRTVDAVGAHGVIVLGAPVDSWNPNVIRSSLGGLFSVPVVHASYDEYFQWCSKEKVATYAAALNGHSKDVFHVDLKGSISLILGSEATGLTQSVLSKVDVSIKIPMNGICDSLNISVAAGILMYEALRQRSS